MTWWARTQLRTPANAYAFAECCWYMLRFADAITNDGSKTKTTDHVPSWPVSAKLSHALEKRDSDMPLGERRRSRASTVRSGPARARARLARYAAQQCFDFLPDPQGHGALRGTRAESRRWTASTSSSSPPFGRRA